MDCRGSGRRSRRRCRYNQNNIENIPYQQNQNKPESIFNTFCSILITISLISLIYLMLDHHCSNCTARHSMNKIIAKDINDLAHNLSLMKMDYYNLEKQVHQFSQDFPKFEGQIQILELFANKAMEAKGSCLSNVNDSPNKQPQNALKKNATKVAQKKSIYTAKKKED